MRTCLSCFCIASSIGSGFEKTCKRSLPVPRFCENRALFICSITRLARVNRQFYWNRSMHPFCLCKRPYISYLHCEQTNCFETIRKGNLGKKGYFGLLRQTMAKNYSTISDTNIGKIMFRKNAGRFFSRSLKQFLMMKSCRNKIKLVFPAGN